MQKRLNKLSVSGKGYVIKADVANCFASVNQHALMDLLEFRELSVAASRRLILAN